MNTPIPAAVRTFDVLIVGAGPAGAATALALRRSGIESVGLLQPPPPLRNVQRFRFVETAGLDFPRLLARLGLESAETDASGSSVQTASAARSGARRWHSYAPNVASPVWQIDRERLDRQLLVHALARGAELQVGHVQSCFRTADGCWRLHLSTRQPGRPRHLLLAARLVVDASGRRSALARHLGAQRLRIDRQVAIAADVSVPPDGELASRLRRQVVIDPADDGWWYAARRPEGQVMLSWMSDNDLQHGLRTAGQWIDLLAGAEHLAGLVGRISIPDRLHHLAADSACLDRVAGDGWLAVGDALMSLDPLVSCGIGAALRDALDATEEVLLPWLGGTARALPAQRWATRANRIWQQFLADRLQQYQAAASARSGSYWQRRLSTSPTVLSGQGARL